MENIIRRIRSIQVFVKNYFSCEFSQTSLIRTPKGQNEVSALKRCPYYRGREYMIFGISGTKRSVRNREVSVLSGAPNEDIVQNHLT